MTKKYETPTAFRTALEERLKNFSKKYNWEPKFNKLAKECGMDCNIKQAFEQVEAFISKMTR